LEDVYDDPRKMKVKGWGGKMKNREEWRWIVPEAKARPELWRQWEGRKEGRKEMIPLFPDAQCKLSNNILVKLKILTDDY
jgi:hypothetical protein